eukprot:Rhum_TRINITY_DN14632_c10_g2::Rhum_TRINITY_DN14632_c10_g2_i1::g.106428::m.106428
MWGAFRPCPPSPPFLRFSPFFVVAVDRRRGGAGRTRQEVEQRGARVLRRGVRLARRSTVNTLPVACRVAFLRAPFFSFFARQCGKVRGKGGTAWHSSHPPPFFHAHSRALVLATPLHGSALLLVSPRVEGVETVVGDGDEPVPRHTAAHLRRQRLQHLQHEAAGAHGRVRVPQHRIPQAQHHVVRHEAVRRRQRHKRPQHGSQKARQRLLQTRRPRRHQLRRVRRRTLRRLHLPRQRRCHTFTLLRDADGPRHGRPEHHVAHDRPRQVRLRDGLEQAEREGAQPAHQLRVLLPQSTTVCEGLAPLDHRRVRRQPCHRCGELRREAGVEEERGDDACLLRLPRVEVLDALT